MNKRNIPPCVKRSSFAIEAVLTDRQKPYVMRYCDSQGHSLDLYICCFCNSLEDLSLKARCQHFCLVSDINCPYFSKVSDPVIRINQLIAAKEEYQCVNGQT